MNSMEMPQMNKNNEPKKEVPKFVKKIQNIGMGIVTSAAVFVGARENAQGQITQTQIFNERNGLYENNSGVSEEQKREWYSLSQFGDVVELPIIPGNSNEEIHELKEKIYSNRIAHKNETCVVLEKSDVYRDLENMESTDFRFEDALFEGVVVPDSVLGNYSEGIETTSGDSISAEDLKNMIIIEISKKEDKSLDEDLLRGKYITYTSFREDYKSQKKITAVAGTFRGIYISDRDKKEYMLLEHGLSDELLREHPPVFKKRVKEVEVARQTFTDN